MRRAYSDAQYDDSTGKFGEPQPVTASQPGAAVKPYWQHTGGDMSAQQLFVPTVKSVKPLPFDMYSAVLTKPSEDLPAAKRMPLISVTTAAIAGDDALVPLTMPCTRGKKK